MYLLGLGLGLLDYGFVCAFWLDLGLDLGLLFLCMLFDPSIAFGLAFEFVLGAAVNDNAAANDDNLRHIV